MARTITIRHQEKKTKEGEERPTQFMIFEDGVEPKKLDLVDIDSELRWLVGKYPTGMRDVDPAEDITVHGDAAIFSKKKEDEDTTGRHPSQLRREIFLARKVLTTDNGTKDPYLRKVEPTEDVSNLGGDNVTFTRLKSGEKYEGRHESQIRTGKVEVAREVPVGYDGIRPDDTYVSMMGGSGHQLMAAISQQLDKLGGPGKAYHIPPHMVVNRYGRDRDKDNDVERLYELFKEESKIGLVKKHRDQVKFHLVQVADRKIALVKSCWALRKAAQQARIAHELRLRKISIMEAYASPEAYIGAKMEVETLKRIKGDEEFEDLKADESAATRALDAAVQDTDVFVKLLSKVEGIGPSIAGALVAAIGTIERFHTPWELAKYCGVAIVQGPNGPTIMRRRSGEFSGWNNDARKGLWNFADQCNRRPGSVWGQHLLSIKAKLKEKYPEPKPFEKVSVPAKEAITYNKETEQQEKVNIPAEKKTVLRYTKGHIHKIAIWRVQSDFIQWLWREWKRLNFYGDPKDFRPPGNRAKEIVNQDEATQVPTNSECESQGGSQPGDATPSNELAVVTV